MMIAGPALVDFAMPGPHHDKNELGGSHVHVTNGAIDDEAESEDEAFALARRFLSYLPTSVDELPPRADSDDDPERREEALAFDRAAQPAPRLQDASHHRRDRRSRELTARRRSSRSGGSGASRSSAASLASTAGPSRCSPRTRTSTAARGRRRRRRRSRASSTSRAPSTCRSSISSTARASSSGCKPSKRARSATGRARWPRSARARRRTARWSSARRSVWREPRTGGPAASTTGARGRRATGARCRSRAASRWRTRPSSRRPTTETRTLRRSGLASTECARRSEAPKRSTSRTSSIRATRAPSCAGGPTSSHACDDQDRARSASAREPRVLGRGSRHL